MTITESVIEQAGLDWLESAGWAVRNGAKIAPGDPAAERTDYRQVVLEQRLQDALARLNPELPAEALEHAFRKLTRPEGADLVAPNRSVHRLLVDGVTVEYRTADGDTRGAQVRVVDFDRVEANDWLAVNQFSVMENKHSRRPDMVLFVNGLPLAVLELKNATDENATIWSAFAQLQTYMAEIPSLFTTNALLVISDGVQARVGTLTAGREWFKPWRTIAGEELADAHVPEMQVVIEGICAPCRFLDLVRDFVVFEDDGGGCVMKKMAGYHQFHAVQVAVAETSRAAELQRAAEPSTCSGVDHKPGGKPGDRRIGVVWHTQGSGKSLTMAFYAGRIIREPAMENPTVVVLTDRNDLDDQLFGTFSRCHDLLRQPPVQAEGRAHLRDLLSVAAGGVVFTTIHKFFPEEKANCTRRSPNAATSS
jgi:type I restriction enzyme R subunit